MIYVDTSVLVALHLREPHSAEVARWYESCRDDLVSAHWCATEFASALSIKQRTAQIDAAEANACWHRFERQCANDLQLLAVPSTVFHAAAGLALDVAGGLRAGDALHAAMAVECKARSIATLDAVLAAAAARLKLKLELRLR